MKRAAILLAFAVAGCSIAEPQPEWHWAKTGASSSDYDTDDGYCTAQAFQSTQNLLQAAIVKTGCMRGKGWRQVSR